MNIIDQDGILPVQNALDKLNISNNSVNFKLADMEESELYQNFEFQMWCNKIKKAGYSSDLFEKLFGKLVTYGLYPKFEFHILFSNLVESELNPEFNFQILFDNPSCISDKQLKEIYHVAMEYDCKIFDNALQYIPVRLRDVSICLRASLKYFNSAKYIAEADQYHSFSDSSRNLLYTCAVQKWGLDLINVPEHNRTYEIYLAAVKQDNMVIRYVSESMHNLVY